MSINRNKTVLITGASGVLGRQVTNRFLDAGWDVTGEKEEDKIDDFIYKIIQVLHLIEQIKNIYFDVI